MDPLPSRIPVTRIWTGEGSLPISSSSILGLRRPSTPTGRLVVRIGAALRAVGTMEGIEIPSYKRQAVQCFLLEQEEFEMFERRREVDFADAPGRS